MEEPIEVPALDALIEQGRVAGHGKPWTEDDEVTMRAYYGRSRVGDLAKHLGRSVSSVRNKAEGMGLQGERDD